MTMLDERRDEPTMSEPPLLPPPLGASDGAEPALNVRELLRALQCVRDGDFSVRLPGDWTGLNGKVADTFNEIVASNAALASQLKSVGQEVGKQGKTRQRVACENHRGAWGGMEG